jgi:hypothetical protein
MAFLYSVLSLIDWLIIITTDRKWKEEHEITRKAVRNAIKEALR